MRRADGGRVRVVDSAGSGRDHLPGLVRLGERWRRRKGYLPNFHVEPTTRRDNISLARTEANHGLQTALGMIAQNDLAAMRLHDGPRDCEPKTDAAGLAAARAFEPDEGFEDLVQLILGQARPSSAMVTIAVPKLAARVTWALSP